VKLSQALLVAVAESLFIILVEQVAQRFVFDPLRFPLFSYQYILLSFKHAVPTTRILP